MKVRREARLLVAEAAMEMPVTAAQAADVLTSAMNDSHSLLQRLKANLASGRLEAQDLIALGDWIDRTARIGKMVKDAGVEERKIELAEGQGRLIAVVVQRILSAMEERVLEIFGNDQFARDRFTSLWPAAVQEIAPRELRAIGDEAS